MTQESAIQPASVPITPSPYELLMLVLCIAAIASLAVDVTVPLSADSRQILRWADNGLCGLFFLDFLISLARAPNRLQYVRTWGWIDLLSSIPAFDLLRIGRGARIIRILRVLRGVRATKLLASFVLNRRAEGTFLAAVLVSLILIVFSAVAILQFENVEGSNIKGAEDALWWAFVTITTVGYGDRFPVTPEGRVIGALLMTAGVGLFGTLSGFVAAWFLAPDNARRESEIARLTEQVAALQGAIVQAGGVRMGDREDHVRPASHPSGAEGP